MELLPMDLSSMIVSKVVLSCTTFFSVCEFLHKDSICWILLNTLPRFLHWHCCGMLGPLPLYSGTLFPNSEVWSGGVFHSYVCVLIASTFWLKKLFAAVHIVLFCLAFVCEALNWILFICSHHLVQQLYTNLWENDLIMRLIAPTKASLARSKSAASLSIPGKDTPGNRYRVESWKVLIFALKE